MPFFKKKPITIEAIQFDGENTIEIMSFHDAGSFIYPKDGDLTIITLEGDMTCKKGDWIIRGVHGEFYPCNDQIFRKTYDEVSKPDGELRETLVG